MQLKLMYVTNNLQVAEIAQKYGVDRIWIDLETLGKQERQGHINSVKSDHTINDIKRIKKILTTSQLLVRVNPINAMSKDEIQQVIAAGADIVMLPMWKSVEEVKEFIKYINGQAKIILLLETKEAVECLDEVLKLNGIDEIHIGLNDLHLSYGMTFMFEPLKNGLVEEICNKIKPTNIPYGFGGIARIGEGMLKAEKIVAEHYRLGSTRAILSRSFCNTEIIRDIDEIDRIFKENIAKLKQYEEFLDKQDEKFFIKNQAETAVDIEKVVDYIKARRK